MALGSFGEKCKKAIFVHFWLPFLVLALSCNFFLLLFLVKNQQTRKENTNIRHAVPPWGILLTCRAQKSQFASNGGSLGEKLPSDPEHPRSVQSTVKKYFRMSPTVFMHQNVIFKPFLGNFGSFLAHFGSFGAI